MTGKQNVYKKKKYQNKKKGMKMQNRVVASTKALVSSMKNYFDIAQSNPIANTGQVISVNNIVQGSSNVNRNGDTISICSYYIKHSFIIADTTNYVRCWLVLDKSSDGAVPLITDIFQTPSVATVPQLWALNDRNKHRFRILRDTTIKMDQDDPIVIKEFKGVFKRPLRTTFLDNTGTATAFGQNQLYLVYASDSIAVAHPTAHFNSRVYFFP